MTQPTRPTPAGTPSTVTPSSLLRALRASPLFVRAYRDEDSAGNRWFTVEHQDGLVTWEWSLSVDAREISVLIQDDRDRVWEEANLQPCFGPFYTDTEVLRGSRALAYFAETVGANQ
jgi:hypothetical protein